MANKNQTKLSIPISSSIISPLPYEQANEEAVSHLMEQPSDKTSQDQARESLIAIAYTSPEEEEEAFLPSSDVKPVITTTTNGVAKGNTQDVEKLRSELISISYDQSPSPVVVVSQPTPNGI